MEVTINVEAILSWIATVGYPLLKIVSSYYITKREFEYTIWNKEGTQVPRGLRHRIRAYIRNFTFNPEWAIVKLIAFIPIWLFTGKKYWHLFSPWHIQKTPPFCRKCSDRGEYFTPSMFTGAKGNWVKCEECSQLPPDKPDCTCVVCLDTGRIGPDRSCPHCSKRRSMRNREDWACSPDETIPDETINPFGVSGVNYELWVCCGDKSREYNTTRFDSIMLPNRSESVPMAITSLMNSAEKLLVMNQSVLCRITKNGDTIYTITITAKNKGRKW